jgi:enoyl-CoA hydratase/carnithine racemase
LAVPVVSAVHGTVLGGGLAIALHSDCVVSSKDATFQHGELTRGLTPAALFTRSMSEVAGHSIAVQFYLRNDRLSAGQAKEVGLVQHMRATKASTQAERKSE